MLSYKKWRLRRQLIKRCRKKAKHCREYEEIYGDHVKLTLGEGIITIDTEKYPDTLDEYNDYVYVSKKCG